MPYLPASCWSGDQRCQDGPLSPADGLAAHLQAEKANTAHSLEEHMCRQDVALMQLLTSQTRAESVLDQLVHSVRSIQKSSQVRTIDKEIITRTSFHGSQRLSTNGASDATPSDVILEDRTTPDIKMDDQVDVSVVKTLATSKSNLEAIIEETNNMIDESRSSKTPALFKKASLTPAERALVESKCVRVQSIEMEDDNSYTAKLSAHSTQSCLWDPASKQNRQGSVTKVDTSRSTRTSGAYNSIGVMVVNISERMSRKFSNKNRAVRWTSACSHVLRRGVQLLVSTAIFDVWCALLILGNAVMVGMETDMTSSGNSDIMDVFFYMNYSLNTWFTLELILRIISEGRGFFASSEWKWNVFDTVLVVCCIADMFVSTLDGSGLQVGRVFRAVRLFRILRTLKIVRVLQYVREFRKMAYALACSVKTLLWSFLLLFFVMYTFAIWFTQGAIDSLTTDGPHAGLEEYYGSLGRSIYTLYLAITNGLSWKLLISPLMERDQWSLVAMFVLYISISVWGVLNVLTAVFVESAMQTTQHYRDLMVQDKMQNKETYISHIIQIFREIDTDRSGSITMEELESFFEDDELQLRSYFEALELNPTDARALFKLLDTDNSGEVDIAEFCQGCLRLKGEARSFDLQCLMYEQRRTFKKIMRAIDETYRHMDELDMQHGARNSRVLKSIRLSNKSVMSSAASSSEGSNAPPIADERTPFADDHL